MKKTMIAALALAMSLSLCACGEAKTEEETNLQPLSPVIEEIPASESNLTEQEPPASESDAQPQTEAAEAENTGDRLALAQEYVGRTAEELIAAFGEPNSSEYASSCEEENAEDGMLMYDGFYVWTLRTADDELVRAVYED